MNGIGHGIGIGFSRRSVASSGGETPVAYDYLITSEAERATVMALPSATLAGKTVAFAPGDYTWVASEWSSRAFPSAVTFTSQFPANRARLVCPANTTWAAAQNMTFQDLRFYSGFTPGVSNPAHAVLVQTGAISGLTFERCDFASNLDELALDPAAVDYMEGVGLRGFLASDGSTHIAAGATYRIADCVFRGLRRGFNIRVGSATNKAGIFELIGNDFYGISSDCGVIAGTTEARVTVAWNTFHDFAALPIVQYQVASVDTVANTMTITGEKWLAVASGGALTVNIGSSTTTPPGGTNLPGVGGSNDYACTITRSGGNTIVAFPVDITSAGSNVWLNAEPTHTDGVQGIPGYGTTPTNWQVYGNRMLLEPGPDGQYPQGLFFEDVANSTDEGHYVDFLGFGNLIYSASGYGLAVYNPIRATLAANTSLRHALASTGNMSVLAGNQFGWGGGDNLLIDNVAPVVGITSPVTGLLSGNHVLASGYGASGLFAGPDTRPTTIAELTARYARTDLVGAIDYGARTYDLALVNSVTTSPALSFAAQTDVAQSSYAVAGPVQVTAITNGQGAAASYGASVVTDGAEFRITSNADGSGVLTDWTTTPATVTVGQYVWLRVATGAVASVTHRGTIRIGRGFAEFEATTGATASGAPANTVLPAITGTQVVGETLTASTGTWTNSPTSYAYQWKRGGASISGATASTYLLVSADEAQTITVTVTATNASGSASATSAGVGPIAAASGFTRVTTDGTARLSRASGFSGAADGKAGTFAFKGVLGAAGNSTARSLVVAGTTNRQIEAQITSANNFRILMRDAGNVVRMQLDSTGVTLTSALGEVTILASWDVASGLSELWINGVSRKVATTMTDAVLKFATTQTIGVLGESDGAPTFIGGADYVYFGAGYLDLSVSANRDKFATPTGMAADGSGATGSQPLLYAVGPASEWNGGTANKGSGGAFTATGTFT